MSGTTVKPLKYCHAGRCLYRIIIPQGQNFFRKILREVSSNKSIYKAIVREKPDIIHANDLNALIPAYMAARRLKCALIYDTHEIFLENPWISGNKPVKLIWSVFERYIIKRVDLVVCVSHAAADYFKRKYKIQKPVVITNCIAARKPCARYCPGEYFP